jgi:hypothetical protein
VRRASPLVAALSIMSAAACAQPANRALKSLETCFESARAADAICSNPANDAVRRLNCLEKARAVQLECLNDILAGAPTTGSASSETPAGASSPAVPTGTASQPAPPVSIVPKAPAEQAAPDSRPEDGPPDRRPTGSVSPDPAPPSAEAGSPAMPTGTSSQQAPPVTAPLKAPAEQAASDRRPEEGKPDRRPTGSVSPDPVRPADNAATPQVSNWVVSETTSPLDYTPVIAAVTRSTSKAEDAPTSFTVRCRAQRAEVFVGTQATLRGSRGNEVQVAYKVDDRPAVWQPWIASEDGKTLSYKDDALELLRSLPDEARLKIRVFDSQGTGHEATFQLAGLDVVRKKIELACKALSTVDMPDMPPPRVRKTLSRRVKARQPNHSRDGEINPYRKS